MEADTDISLASDHTSIDGEDILSQGDSQHNGSSISAYSWVDTNDITSHKSRSRKVPSLKGSVHLSRGSLLGKEDNDVGNILITEYGYEANDDDLTCLVSSESEESEADVAVDYDTDLDLDIDAWLHGNQQDLKNDLSGEKRYISACEEIGVTPVTYFIKHIADHEVAMRFHGLGPQGTKSLCVPLRINNKIEKLDLEGNWVEESGCICLADMLRENIYITELILSENKIGSPGAISLCNILMKNDTVVKVDISGNEIKDSAAESICEMLQKNTTLHHLYLHHNHFEEEGALYFKEALSHNESLETLDLSWNRFRTKGAVYIAEGIQENYGLRTLNFAMNGLGLAGSEAMGKALKVNRTLTDLDISFNRIPEGGAGHVALGLQVNDCLCTLKISSNPLGSHGALALLMAVDRNDCSSLKYLEMLEVWVHDDFIQLKEKLEMERSVIVVYGGLNKRFMKLATMKGVEWEKWLSDNPMHQIKKYVRQTGYRLIDLFREFDKDKNMSITKDEFVRGIRSAGILMTNDQIEDLIRKLDRDGNGEVDYAELIEGDKEYRQAVRKAASKKKTFDDEYVEDPDTPDVIKMLDSDRSSGKSVDKNSDKISINGKISENGSEDS